MRVAIIDVGSNNIKLEIHYIVNDAFKKYTLKEQNFSQLIFSEKIRARLGKLNFTYKKIQEDRMQVAIDALKIFKRMIDKYKCEDYVALGTAALREAENSDIFIDRVFYETGLKINVISGLEEARLVYLGVASTLGTKKTKKILFNDIGGGSTEISIVKNGNMYFRESLPLGTLRLQDFFPTDYFTRSRSVQEKKKYIDKVKSYIYEVIKNDISNISPMFNGEMLSLSTGGTSRNLLEIIQYRTNIKNFSKKYGMPFFKKNALKKLIFEIRYYDLRTIEKIPVLDTERADIIFIGALILYHLMKFFKIKKCFVSSKGLRDGALLEFCSKKMEYVEVCDIVASHRSIFERLRNQYPKGLYLAQKLSALVLKLSNTLVKLLELSNRDFFILEVTSLFFNIGLSIGYKNYAEHSIYILRNLEMSFISSLELEFVLLLIKYHNRGTPVEKEWKVLSYSKEYFFRLLSIIKIAYAVVKMENNGVEGVSIESNNNEQIIIAFSAQKKLQFEVENASKKKKYLEKVLNKKIYFKYKEV